MRTAAGDFPKQIPVISSREASADECVEHELPNDCGLMVLGEPVEAPPAAKRKPAAARRDAA